MKPPLPAIWTMCTIAVGCCLFLSNFPCKSPSTMIVTTLKTRIKSTTTPLASKHKISLLNLSCPLFKVFDDDDSINPTTRRFSDYFKLRKYTVTRLPSEYNMSGRLLCQDKDGDAEVTLLIIIPSIVKDSSLRIAIRETWASEIYKSKRNQHYTADTSLPRPDVKVAFFFGNIGLTPKDKTILEKESTMFNDVVTINIVESYRNLSLKVASSLLWAATMCSRAKFVAKVDMDTMVNIPLMLQLLHQVTLAYDNPAMVIGYRHVSMEPSVTRRGRWAVPRALYPLNHFPRYVYGHSYVMTKRAIIQLVKSFPYFPLIPNEDAFITGVMSQVANVKRVHSAAFTHLFRKQTCHDVQYGRFLSFGHKKKNLRHLWSQLSNGNCSPGFIS